MDVSPPETWALNLSANEEVVMVPPSLLVVTNVSLPAVVEKEEGRTSLILTYTPVGGSADVSVTLATLFKNRSDNHMLMVKLIEGRQYVFKAEGPNSLDIIGYFCPLDDEESEGYVSDCDQHTSVETQVTLKEKGKAPSRKAGKRSRGSSVAKTVEEESDDEDDKATRGASRSTNPPRRTRSRSRLDVKVKVEPVSSPSPPASPKASSSKPSASSSAKASGGGTSKKSGATAKKAPAAAAPALGKRKVKG